MARPDRGEIVGSMMAAIIEARDLVKRFDGLTAVDHISFAVEAGVIFGFLGPQRRRQDDDDQDVDDGANTERGVALDRRPRPSQGAAAGAPGLWHRVPGSEPRRGTDGSREHGAARCALPRARGGAPYAGR